MYGKALALPVSKAGLPAPDLGGQAAPACYVPIAADTIDTYRLGQWRIPAICQFLPIAATVLRGATR